MSPKNTTRTTNTDSSSRRVSDGRDTAAFRAQAQAPWVRAISFASNGEAVAAPAQCFDGSQRFVGIELAAQAPDEHFDDIAVALVVLVVEPFGELGLGDHVAGAQHHVLEDAVFEGGQFDGRTASVTACARVSSRMGPHSRIGDAQPPARRISACMRASTSSK